MKLSDIDETFLTVRRDALEDRWAARNKRMDEYEKHYLLDIWKTEQNPDQLRISPPICWTRVEAFRPLFLTHHPVISVPPSEVRAVEAQRADSLEKYLYCVWHQARVMDALDRGEQAASLFGEGVLRCVSMDKKKLPPGEFPILVQPLDPRNVYATPGPKEGQDLEVMHFFDRSRREIEDEWGRGKLKKSRPTGGEQLEEWLDEEVEFVDYWRTDIMKVDAEPGPAPEPVGVVQQLVSAARGLFNLPEPEAPEPEKPEKVNKRVITNAVMADGEIIKKAVRMPGYNRLPYIRYPGIATILQDENSALSVLFPITGGKGGTGSQGVAAAYTELLNMKQEIIKNYANAATFTDDPDLAKDGIDFSLRAVNQIGPGKTVNFLVHPGTAPDVDQLIQQFEGMIEDATVSRSMMGRHVGDLSGLALSAINNPVLMKIAHRQQIRERAYEQLNELILSLTEEYAPDEGWYVWGQDKDSVVSEAQLRPDEIGGYYRNRVELSASLPKDDAGEIMSLSNLVDKSQLSLRTFLDRFQRIKGLSNQSPDDEIKRILIDKIVMGSPLSEKLAELVAADWDPELGRLLQEVQAEQQAPAGPPSMPPGMAPGQTMPPGMGGMSPGMMPPGAMPEALPPQTAMNLMNQGGPPIPR